MNHIFSNKSGDRLSGLYTVFSLFLLIILLLAISSCELERPYIKSTEPMLQEVEVNGVYVECKYMNYRDLEKKHGYKANPFLPPDLALTPKQTIVFDLKIRNNDSAPVMLNIKDVDLLFGDTRYRPMSPAEMQDNIEEYAERNENLEQNRVAKKFMLPYIKTIGGNRTESGYLVFMGGFRGRNIPTELSLTFTTLDKHTAAEINFTYTLTLLKK